MHNDTIYVSTDGACLDNPGGAGGWTFVLRQGETTLEKAGSSPQTTNNRMELRAILEGLQACYAEDDVVVRSDSQYAIKVSMGTWNARANLDLVSAVREEADRVQASFAWVEGHSGDVDNERADTLARRAAENPAREVA